MTVSKNFLFYFIESHTCLNVFLCSSPWGRYPGSTFMDHVLRYQDTPGIKMIVVLGEVRLKTCFTCSLGVNCFVAQKFKGRLGKR